MKALHLYQGQDTTDNSAALVKEIDRLTALCQEYRENGDRLMRVADEYKAELDALRGIVVQQADEIERLNQLAVDVYKLDRESYLKMMHDMEWKDAEIERLKEVINLQVENYAELKEQYEAQGGYFNSVMVENDQARKDAKLLNAKTLPCGWRLRNLSA